MWVRPKFRGLGYGKLMLDHLAAYATAHDIYLLRLETGILFSKPPSGYTNGRASSAFCRLTLTSSRTRRRAGIPQVGQGYPITPSTHFLCVWRSRDPNSQ